MSTLPPVTPSSASSIPISSFIVPTGGGSWDGQASLMVRIKMTRILRMKRLLMLIPREGLLPVLRSIVRCSVAVAVPPHQPSPFVHLAKGNTLHHPHIEQEEEEEKSQAIGSLFHHHLHLLDPSFVSSQNHPFPDQAAQCGSTYGSLGPFVF